MVAHIYCRISTNKGGSQQYQVDKCIEYCNDNNLEIKSIHKHVQSSRNMQNGKYLESIIDTEMKEGDILIVHSICRFSRNMIGGLKILDKLESKGMRIYSVDDHIGYDNIHDKFRFRNIMNCAELETDKISHRVKQSYEKKRKLNTITYTNKRQKINNSFIQTSLSIYNN
jgi:site-specific DNA recombinase